MPGRVRILLLAALALVPSAAAAPEERSRLVVTPKDFHPVPGANALVIRTPPYDPNQPGAGRAPVVGMQGVDDRILRWVRERTATGHLGDLYDNRDRGHSELRLGSFPQLTAVEYSDAAKAANLDYGVMPAAFLGRVVIGNSSTALPGPMWRSNPRRCLTDSTLLNAVVNQYQHNNIYVYPEHRDYDPGHNGENDGYGDVFPANSPYMVISQGSSGSDRVFVQALLCVMAAYHPAVKKTLIERGMIAPTTQMILRRTYGGVRTADDYLSGRAHPTVFEGKLLDRDRMVDLAHSLTLEDLPPVAALKVTGETLGRPGVDYFEAGDAERIFDTPFVVGRIHRSYRRTYRIEVEAKPHGRMNDRPLRYHWRLLRGDERRVRFVPLTPESDRMAIEVDYHERRPIAEGDPLESNRVDIGVFIDNGAMISAPSFVSIGTLDSEARVYDEAGRIVEIDHAAGEFRLDVKRWPPLLDLLTGDEHPPARRWVRSALGAGADAELTAIAREHAEALADPGPQPDKAKRPKPIELANAVLDRDRPALGRSARRWVFDAVRRTIDDPKYLDTVDPAAWARLMDPSSRTGPRITESLELARRCGLIRPIEADSGKGWRLVTDEERPEATGRGLGGTERTILRKLNAQVLCAAVFPGVVEAKFEPNYVDPVLSSRADWCDRYEYADGDRLVGWTRRHSDGRVDRFTAQGWRVTEADASGRPIRAIQVRYVRRGSEEGVDLEQTDGEAVYSIAYDSPSDRIGKVVGRSEPAPDAASP